MFRWVLLAFFISLCATAEAQKKKAKTQTQNLSRGWGKTIKWIKSYEDGLSELGKSQKPLMVIHHLDNCPHSKALKEAFVADKSIQKMAKENFIMLNVVEETGDKNLAPDGYYVPRILFVDPALTVRTDIVGKYSNRLYAYGPEDMKLLAANMKKAKLLLKNEL
ncbi:anterior gradient 1 [Cyprinodon tularosa]|uniref:anterior gradient 1 n=1 Tax=Cyprinodon tularosa TaxID=77115 RepID=UPI0018E2821F|nr:anterior gradient 1 [Cyprinodon tularosa]XP_038161025.1 anterior gradient 1 [Cyprinodon tularosa]XP_038161026.1 anterior gradient 1 [Cyprinodon tularosa]